MISPADGNEGHPSGPPKGPEDDGLGGAAHNFSPAPLSKNAQKRLLKATRRAELKVMRKLKDKERRQSRKHARALGSDDGTKPPPKRIRPDIPRVPFPAKIVIDLDFDKLMSEKECASLCSQLSYTYSSQRKSCAPFSSLIFSSLGGKVEQHLETVEKGAHARWKHVEWWKDGYDQIWNKYVKNPDEPLPEEYKLAKSQVVYLTADSDEEINELKPGETYIIGGLVDRNRYKALCLDKANKQGVRTAKLPIGTYLAELKTRKVLTVNQVFDILLHWNEHRDWDGIKHVMPKRKMKNPNVKPSMDNRNSPSTHSPALEGNLEELQGSQNVQEAL